MWRDRQGNVLISAIFIAVFLFFLSVALVSVNRQDLNLTVLADHKLRARHAAEEAANYCLQTMENDPLWESKFLAVDYTKARTGDVTWSVTVKPKPYGKDEEKTKTVHFYEIVGRGVSGVYSSEHRILVEEFRISDSVAKRDKKPYVFGLDEKTLVMMDPAFKWHRLATLEPRFNVSSLTGNGGDVLITAGSTLNPPSLMDWSPTMQGGFAVAGALQAGPQLPPANDVLKLVLDGNQMSWKALPDPNDPSGGLMKQANGSVDGQPEGATPRIVFVQINGHAQAVDVSLYKGPMLEEYIVDGDLHATVTSVFAHATHYFYKGSLMQNQPVPGGGNSKPGKLFSAPALLRFDNNGKVWTVVTDMMKVTDPYSEPEISTGPRPDKSYLFTDASSGTVYCISKVKDQPTLVLEAQPRGFKETNLALDEPTFFSYGGKLRSLQRTSAQDPLAVAFTDLLFTPLYPVLLPEMTGLKVNQNNPNNPLTNITVQDARSLRWSHGKATNGVVVAEPDIVTTASVAIAPVIKNEPPKSPTSYTFLCHYDGSRWQIWPSGLDAILKGKVPAGSPLIPITQGEVSIKLSPSPLALGGFSSGKLLRRYQIVLVNDL